MKTGVGEYIVGAYLKIIEKCDFVDYNVRSPGGGLKGLREFDVIGLRFSDRTAYVCEVTTHIEGLKYGRTKADTYDRIKKKHEAQKAYAEEHLRDFGPPYLMFWSPVVAKDLTRELEEKYGENAIINSEYTRRVWELMQKLRKDRMTQDVGNPFFRTLQILEFSKFFKLLEEQRNTQEQVSP